MSEMTERVARAIFKGKWTDGFGSDGLDPDELSFNGTPSWKQYEEDARLAIEAMYQPTDSMDEVGAVHSDCNSATRTWQAMIKEALK